MNLRPLVFFAFLALTSLGCSSDSTSRAPTDRVTLVDGGRPDAGHMDASARDAMMHDMPRDGAMASDQGHALDATSRPIPVAQQEWMVPVQGCLFAEPARASDEPFVKPPLEEGPFQVHGPLTSSYLYGFGGGAPGGTLPDDFSIQVITYDPTHRADGTAYNVYASPGEEFKFYYHMANGNEDYDQYRYIITTTVDYEPVHATYSLWRNEREEGALQEYEGTGWVVEFKDQYSYVNVEIPAETFTEERTHHVAIHVEGYKPGKITPTGFVYRMELHHGGFSRDEVPCFEPPQQLPLNAFERAVDARSYFRANTIALFPADNTVFEQVYGPGFLDVQPGQTVRLNASLATAKGWQNRDYPAILMPVLNGEPIGPTWHVSTRMLESYPNQLVIDARKSFEMTMPEEPGEYLVTVKAWFGPYTTRIHRGEDVVEDIPTIWSQGSSNTLRFRVVDSSTP